MYKIVIDKELKDMKDEIIIKRAIKNIISKNSKLVIDTLKETEQPMEMVYNTIYEAKKEGTILHREFGNMNLKAIHLEIYLIGFDENNSENFKELKENLEEIVYPFDIEKIKKKHLHLKYD